MYRTLRERLEATSRARKSVLSDRLRAAARNEPTPERLEHLRVFAPILLPPTCEHIGCPAHR